MAHDRPIPDSWKTKIARFDADALEGRARPCKVEDCFHLADRRNSLTYDSGLCPIHEDEDRKRRWGK